MRDNRTAPPLGVRVPAIDDARSSDGPGTNSGHQAPHGALKSMRDRALFSSPRGPAPTAFIRQPSSPPSPPCFSFCVLCTRHRTQLQPQRVCSPPFTTLKNSKSKPTQPNPHPLLIQRKKSGTSCRHITVSLGPSTPFEIPATWYPA